MTQALNGVLLDMATLGDDLNMAALQRLPVRWQCFDATAPEQVMSRIDGAQVVLSNKVVLDAATIEAASQLEYIGVLATGTNNVDVDAALNGGITVRNVEGYGTASVAQHTLMLMLNLMRRYRHYQRAVDTGQWSRAEQFCLMDEPLRDLNDKHLVIVGYGELGQEVARLARAFDMKVSIAARPGQPVSDGREALDTLLPEADIVSLHCLLSEQTRQLINAQRLQRMKPSAVLINTARGGLIDELALADALASGTIGGAGLDVLSQEPPAADHPLLRYRGDNLLITPHNAWASQAARQRLLDIACQHVGDYLARR
ncbi:D-2-hydroxyacid dehydrogenase [Aestuariibacter halophilus]|uniref:D-2-hydroxyacid dehydrogenase n=1 Tax=Fluctibacter halophilus TaxID=226011 RepID=A0ABS8G6Q3_9ALTE|nr:D-2-hydroxyacid dehydrogenase [Aestuariibacter halophilus]MCC2616277.1 D-2-hydroxyacid dehydrogenase [Aestuariibacter halophilus]